MMAETMIQRIAAAMATAQGRDWKALYPDEATWRQVLGPGGGFKPNMCQSDYLAMARAAVEAIIKDRAAMEAMAVELCGMYGNEEYWDTGPITRAEWMNDCQHLLKTATTREAKP